MKKLNKNGIDKTLIELINNKMPFIGICLGLQLMFTKSEEGQCNGLNLFKGTVPKIPDSVKVPHIGWNNLVFPKGFENWEGSLLQEINPGEAVYFVHSFMAVPNNPNHCIANCLYGGVPMPAAIERDNIYGCQFHPEKSGEVGLKILRNFLSR